MQGGHSMETNLLPEELLAYIFMKNQGLTFKSMTIQKCFFNLKKEPEFYPFLKSFRFSGSPAAPFSEVLDNALFNLQLGGKLTRTNPDLEKYSIDEKLNAYYESTVRPKLDNELEKILTKLSSEVKRYLNAWRV